jgi:hypothetical protein
MGLRQRREYPFYDVAIPFIRRDAVALGTPELNWHGDFRAVVSCEEHADGWDGHDNRFDPWIAHPRGWTRWHVELIAVTLPNELTFGCVRLRHAERPQRLEVRSRAGQNERREATKRYARPRGFDRAARASATRRP